jgi:hypothetical protein
MELQALGRYLREARTAKDLALDDAVEALRIRRTILEAFEQGDFATLDLSPVQIRGFLRNYARYLELDDERVLDHYEAGLEEQSRRTQRQRRPSRSKRPRRRSTAASAAPPPARAGRQVTDTQPTLPPVNLGELPAGRDRRRWLRTLGMLVVSTMAVGVIVFVTIELLRAPPDTGSRDDTSPFLGTRLPTAIPTAFPTSIPTRLAPTAIQIGSAYTGRGVLVTLVFDQRALVRVLVDGDEAFSGLARPGDLLEYSGNFDIRVISSNAAGTGIIYNGEAQPQFGGRGQKLEVVFEPDALDLVSGSFAFVPTPVESPTVAPTQFSIASTLLAELTPSSTPGPSPTASPTPSITPTPSVTPTPTDTPTVTPTPSNTPTATDTPSITPTPTATDTPSPTAILPPRRTATPASTPKEQT